MSITAPRFTSFAPQLLVDDLESAIAFYRDVLGFSLGPVWGGFYAIGERDGFAVHLKCAPKTAEDREHRRQHEHLDVYAGVTGIRALYDACTAKGTTILKPLVPTAWGPVDFYIEDPEGYIIAFGENETSGWRVPQSTRHCVYCRGAPPYPPMSQDRSDRTPAPTRKPGEPPAASGRAEIDQFMHRVKALGPAVEPGQRGRLIFALDATMSRQPTWDSACRLQADMFREAAAAGGLDIQLVYYRGLAECRASSWVAEAKRLGALMERIDCRGGHTQIGKVLAHARRENDARKIAVLVFIGDAMEEPLDDLCAAAGELGLRNVKAFMFQEGNDPVAGQAFREIARLTGGAFCRFAPGAAHELAELLRAAAAYAAGGMKALTALKARQSSGAVMLLEQLK